MNKQTHKTDWRRIQREVNQPVIYDPETELYDPNNEAAAHAFWGTAKIVKSGRPRSSIKRPTLNMRIDADVLAHLWGLGKGWQTKLNALLREEISSGKC